MTVGTRSVAWRQRSRLRTAPTSAARRCEKQVPAQDRPPEEQRRAAEPDPHDGGHDLACGGDAGPARATADLERNRRDGKDAPTGEADRARAHLEGHRTIIQPTTSHAARRMARAIGADVESVTRVLRVG